MKKFLALSIVLTCFIFVAKAQSAMQISGVDCYDNPVDMFADLDAGKAIILHFYMPDCGMCPPPAAKIQTMAEDIMVTYPDMIKGYAFPFQNSTTCEYSASWVEDNNLPFYAPMDSGALPVAYYGGFGMPTVVLLGGTEHEVLFSTQSFVTGDTTEMSNLIRTLFGETGINSNISSQVSNVTLSPNPAHDAFEIRADLLENGPVQIEILDLTGKSVLVNSISFAPAGKFSEIININQLPDGLYISRLTAGSTVIAKQIVITH